MKMITPGVAAALTPRTWPDPARERRGAGADVATDPVPHRRPRLALRHVTLHLALPVLADPRRRLP